MKHLSIRNRKFIQAEFGYREWLSVLGYSDNTVYSLPLHVKEFLFFLEQKEINDLKAILPKHLNEHYQLLKNRKHKRKNIALSSAYLNKHIQAFKLFSKYLRETQQGGFSVDLHTEQKEVKTRDILSKQEIIKLYDATSDNTIGIRDRAMLSLFYGCGLRRNEGVLLDTDDILFNRQLVYIRHGKNYTERYIPIKGKVINYLSEYILQGRKQLAKQGSQALFLNQRGQRISSQMLNLRLKDLQQKTNSETLQNKNISLHSLRHSIATHLLMEGMKLERIAQFLGHKSIESTQVYTHIVNELKNQ